MSLKSAAGIAPWIAVLVKDFTTAKTRLSDALSPAARHDMALENGRRALRAAREVAPSLAVCGSQEAAHLAQELGVEVVSDDARSGQNAAAALGLVAITQRGGGAALLLSSDLPLVTAAALQRLLDRAQRVDGPVAVAAAAFGRAGTNALYLRPPDDFVLHFGLRSLPRFAAEARRHNRTFVIHEDVELALDVDEASDLERLASLAQQ